jgi:hypothetical protein
VRTATTAQEIQTDRGVVVTEAEDVARLADSSTPIREL